MILLSLALLANQPASQCHHAGAPPLTYLFICDQAELVTLDREDERLYALAVAATPPAARGGLTRQRRAFRDGQNGCATLGSPSTSCMRNVLLTDIATLRRMPGLARDANGMSSGPLHFRCDDGFPEVRLTFVRTQPAQAWLDVATGIDAQPLLMSPGSQLYVGRYDRDVVFDPASGGLRLRGRTCRLL